MAPVAGEGPPDTIYNLSRERARSEYPPLMSSFALPITDTLSDVNILVAGGGECCLCDCKTVTLCDTGDGYTGLAGLTVALTLAEAGHRVRVIEKRRLGVPAGGIRVPPNASKLLARWVPREELLRIGVPCTGSPLRHREWFQQTVVLNCGYRLGDGGGTVAREAPGSASSSQPRSA